MSQAIIDQAFVIVRLRKWGEGWRTNALAKQTEVETLRTKMRVMDEEHTALAGERDQIRANLIQTESESRAAFDELHEAMRNACLPGESLNDAITRTDRALDTAREQRDQLRVERDSLRAEVTILREEARSMLAELDALRAELDALREPEWSGCE